MLEPEKLENFEFFQNSTFDLIDFVDFLLTRLHPSKNSLDTAIEELKNGEYQTYSSFDDFLSDIENEAWTSYHKKF